MVDRLRPANLPPVRVTPESLPPVPADEWDGDETPRPVQGLPRAMGSGGGLLRSQGQMPTQVAFETPSSWDPQTPGPWGGRCWCNSWCRRTRSFERGWMRWTKTNILLMDNKFNVLSKVNNEMNWTRRAGNRFLQGRPQRHLQTARPRMWPKSPLVELNFQMDRRRLTRWRKILCHRHCLRCRHCLLGDTRSTMKRGSTSGLDLKQYMLVLNKVMEICMASGTAEEVESNKP